MRFPALLSFCLVLCAIPWTGCAPTPATVSGSVLLDGRPLEKGVISYCPAEGEGDTVTANVANGQYELQILPGPKFVQISAPKVIGTRKESDALNAPMVEITEEQLDERYYNSRDLTFEVQPGINTKDWTVERKAKK